MTLSIIIPTYRRLFLVSQLLSSIAKQNFPKQNLQVLLVSNLKDKKLQQASKTWYSLFYDFKYLEVGSKGVNKARNMGIRFASGEILYFLDDDCVLPHPNHLRNLIDEHEQQSSVIGIGGSYESFRPLDDLNIFYHKQSLLWTKEQSNFNNTDSHKKVHQLLGGNSSYKREIFDKGFMFDPQIIFGGSEEGFNNQLVREGYQLLLVSSLWVHHDLKINWPSFIKKAFLQGVGSFKNRYQMEKNSEDLLKKEASFSYGAFASLSFFYNAFFKLGYLWQASKVNIEQTRGFRFITFITLVFKNLWLSLKDSFLLKFFGSIWFALGWFYGNILKYIYGPILLKFFGSIWFALGWFYGNFLLNIFGHMRFTLGWFYGNFLLNIFGHMRFALGWFYGNFLLNIFGHMRFALGWFYGNVLIYLFHKSPVMKIYYFSRYQFNKRLKPWLINRKAKKSG